MAGGKVVWGCFRGLILGIKYVCDNYVNTTTENFDKSQLREICRRQRNP